MARKLNRIDIALKACSALSTRNWVTTVDLIKIIDVGPELEVRHTVVAVLKNLASKNVLSKVGTGKFRWKLINKDYDKSNPFRTAKTEVAAMTATLEDGRYTITGNTFDNKEKLKAIGAAWHKELSAWRCLATPETRQQLEAIGVKIEGSEKDFVVIDDPETSSDSTSEVAMASLKVLAGLSNRIKELESKIVVLEESAKHVSQSVKELTIKVPQLEKAVKLKDVVLPAVYQRVLDLAGMRRNILLVGPAGCGKTHLGKLIADSIGLEMGSVSCTSGMSESHLLGKSVPDLTHGQNKFQTTDFLECYETGGLFLLDELDAADPNLLLAINTAIANNYCNVPNRTKAPRAERHKDFVCIATANTFGRGATRQYAGRNQLDEATLDRFRIGIVECDYDPAVEAVLCPDDKLRTALQLIRTQIQEQGLRRIMSTRFMQDAYIMAEGAKWDLEMIVKTFLEGWTREERNKLDLSSFNLRVA